MKITRLRGPIPENQIDPAIARDIELDWSRIANKPATFTPSSHSHTMIETTKLSNFDNAPAGMTGGSESLNANAANTPLGPQWHHLLSVGHTNLSIGNKYVMQLSSAYFSQRLFFRNIIASAVNSPWYELLHTGNYVEAWQAPSLLSPWIQPTASGFQPLRFRKNNVSNCIEVSGFVQNPNALTSNTNYNIFTLPNTPINYRPALFRQFTTSFINSAGMGVVIFISVNNAGVVSLTPFGNINTNSAIPVEFSMTLL